MPAAFQGASDMFYPSSDFIVSVALNLAGNIGGSAAMLFLSALDRRGGGEANASGVYTMVDSMSVLVGLVGVGVLVAFQVDGTLHRTACDADVPISE